MGWHTIIHDHEAPRDQQRRSSLAPRPSPSHRRASIPAAFNNTQSPSSASHTSTRRRCSSIISPTDLSILRLARRKSLTSRLLALPPEIRNQIYTSCFAIDGIPRIRPDYELPGLLKTCRQVHAEAIGLYYSSNVAFRCLDEDSAVKWLCTLPAKYLDLVREVRYDTRWMIFVTPYIPIPGAECWLCGKLIARLKARGFDLGRLMVGFGVGEKDGEFARDGEEGVAMERGTGKLKVSFYRRGAEHGIVWTDKPGLIEVAREGAR